VNEVADMIYLHMMKALKMNVKDAKAYHIEWII